MAEEFDADAVTELYLKCRRAIANRTKAYDADVAILKAEQDRLAGLMMEFLDAHKIKSAPSTHGVFYKELEIKPAATDWTAFYNWIKENDAFEFLHKRISSEAVKNFMDRHKEDEVGLPPGVSVLKEYKVKVRTGKEK